MQSPWRPFGVFKPVYPHHEECGAAYALDGNSLSPPISRTSLLHGDGSSWKRRKRSSRSNPLSAVAHGGDRHASYRASCLTSYHAKRQDSNARCRISSPTRQRLRGTQPRVSRTCRAVMRRPCIRFLLWLERAARQRLQGTRRRVSRVRRAGSRRRRILLPR